MDPGPELQCPGRHAPNRHVPERVALLLVEVDDKDHFARQDRATFGPPRHATLGFEHVRRGPVDLRSEEHTSELQSPCNLVCRLLLEKKKNHPYDATDYSHACCSH